MYVCVRELCACFVYVRVFARELVYCVCKCVLHEICVYLLPRYVARMIVRTNARAI